MPLAALETPACTREVTPEVQLPKGGLMLDRGDAQKLLVRAVALDCHLQSNLFI